REAEILGRRQPPVLGMHHARPRLAVVGQQAARFRLRRPIVHHDDLDVLERLRQHAVDGFVEILPQVVTGDDHGHARRGHGRVQAVHYVASDRAAAAPAPAAGTSCPVPVSIDVYRSATSLASPSITTRAPSSSSARSQNLAITRGSWLTMMTE